jgi:parallel beta-helix repeat protein
LPSPTTLVVDDDWVGRAPGAQVAPGIFFGQNGFATIGAALSHAEGPSAISHIDVRPGTYDEKVIILRDGVTLRGVGTSRPVISAFASPGVHRSGPAVEIKASDVEVRGFEIIGGAVGVHIACPESNITIADNSVHGSSNVVSSQGVGILVWGACTSVKIKGNEVYNNDRQGIYLGSTTVSVRASSSTIENNDVHDNGANLTGNYGPDPIGIQVHNADDITVKLNHVYRHADNKARLGTGIWVRGDRVRVRDNIAHANSVGISMQLGKDPEVIDNTVHDNKRGIFFGSMWTGSGSAKSNTFCRNAIAGLENQASQPLAAVDCWWGASTGPNTSGADKIVGAVIYAPFAKTPPTSGPCGP